MKIIHCADLHLDATMTANFEKEQAKVRRSELLRTFERMVDYANEKEVSAIVIAGDLFDTERVRSTTKTFVMTTIMAHPDIDFYYLKGNHDLVDLLGSMEENPANLHYFTAEDWRTYPLDTEGRITLTGLELTGENQSGAIARLVLPEDGYHIVTLHGQESRSDSKEQAEVINLNGLKNKNIDYLALGHIHGYREAALDARGTYCYAGCLEGRGFDETGEHGFVLLDIDPVTCKGTREFVPFSYRRIYELPVDVSELTSTPEIAVAINETVENAGVTERDLLRIVLNGNVDELFAVDDNYLMARFREKFFCFQMKYEYVVKVDYGQYALDETLKGEFVRMVNAQKDLSEEEKGRIIRYGLRAIAGEEL